MKSRSIGSGSSRASAIVALLLLAGALIAGLVGRGGLLAEAAPVDGDNNTPQALPFTFALSDESLISSNDNWSGVPGIEGYILRNDSVSTTGVDPRTILGNTFGAGTTSVELDVTADQPSTAASSATFGGVAEFHANMQGGPFPFPIIGMQPDDSADATFMIVNLNTMGRQNINFQYAAYDIDCSSDDAVSLVATQFRIGNTGNFTNVPDEFVSDVTAPNVCTQVNIMGGDLPAAADNKPLVQMRIIMTNAAGADEWVGIELINASGDPFGTPTPTNTPTSTPTNTPTPTPTPALNILINEVDSDQGGDDTKEFIELYDGGVGNVSLSGLIVVLFDGSNDLSYHSVDLDGFRTNAGGYFTIGNNAVNGVDLVLPNGLLQDGTDAVGLYASPDNLPNGTPVTLSGLRDALVYETSDPPDFGLLVLLAAGSQINENEGGAAPRAAMQRCPNGSGGPRSTLTYRVRTPTPDSQNTCLPVTDLPFDFDGDGRADLAVYRPDAGLWFIQRSQAGGFVLQLGVSTDKVASADFDGDGKTDIAVYRPSDGVWYIYNSATGTYTATQFGLAADMPVPGDFDADGRADLAVFRPSTGTWFLQQSTAGGRVEQFGANGDVPVVGDFDGDGRNDFVVWRPSNGVWFERRQTGDFAIQFGSATDKVAAADYDGDGKTDVAIYRPSQGTWYRVNSSDSSYPVQVFGLATDIPVAADYDGDGRADVGIFRPSNGQWWLNRTTAGLTVAQYGLNGDRPIPAAFGN